MSQKSEETRSVQGYSLFDDIEDRMLRIRNQGVSLRNMAVTHRASCGNKLKPEAMSLIMAYFTNIKEEDKALVMEEFTKHCEADGFEIEKRESNNG
jgi:hypothetical protein